MYFNDSVPGHWSVWDPWSQCSVSCAGGNQTRQRYCTNPPPQRGGADCVGEPTEARTCAEWDCPSVAGQWSIWDAWSECSVSCDGGTQTRQRHCMDPAPENGSADCVGIAEETQPCADWNRPGKKSISLTWNLEPIRNTDTELWSCQQRCVC